MEPSTRGFSPSPTPTSSASTTSSRASPRRRGRADNLEIPAVHPREFFFFKYVFSVSARFRGDSRGRVGSFFDEEAFFRGLRVAASGFSGDF